MGARSSGFRGLLRALRDFAFALEMAAAAILDRGLARARSWK
jgi:hypothetical protein